MILTSRLLFLVVIWTLNKLVVIRGVVVLPIVGRCIVYRIDFGGLVVDLVVISAIVLLNVISNESFLVNITRFFFNHILLVII